MFEILMGLPLFKGVSRARMAETAGKSKFHFLKYLPGETIFRAGDSCVDIAFVISGSVRVKIVNPDGRFAVGQTIKAPDVIAPEFLYGKITQYPGTVTAVDTTGLLRISKADYMQILNSDNIFLLNYLNLLSMNAQKAVEGILAVSTGNLPERIAFWISALTQARSRDICLECRSRDLASLFGVPKASLKAALDSMTDEGLISYTPYCINVHDRRALLALLHNHSENPDD
ncbi:MAG: Crp/Fnr family transcriptional regulator [Bacteroidales bacterium]|nr:Crp/Fnr family transcriptional regulator [Bacteroidales bacterium]